MFCFYSELNFIIEFENRIFKLYFFEKNYKKINVILNIIIEQLFF
jgi:hypothetical protein